MDVTFIYVWANLTVTENFSKWVEEAAILGIQEITYTNKYDETIRKAKYE